MVDWPRLTKWNRGRGPLPGGFNRTTDDRLGSKPELQIATLPGMRFRLAAPCLNASSPSSARCRFPPPSARRALCRLHHCSGEFRGGLGLILRRLEQQFVVDLQQHVRREAGVAERVGQADHGALDDVGGTLPAAAR